jgi:predicted O-linked N-acetylglucosamine transferase (SPINDLY family)
MALNCACDVFLDSIGWSGNNTTHEAIAAGLPVITLPGPQMRGRHALALLTKMGMTETVAADLEAFTGLAVRAGSNREWRRHLAAETVARRASIYDDEAPIRDLERFIEQVLTEAEQA